MMRSPRDVERGVWVNKGDRGRLGGGAAAFDFDLGRRLVAAAAHPGDDGDAGYPVGRIVTGDLSDHRGVG